MRIFISHSSRDAETAVKICSVLERDGHSCFIAPRDIRPGREYAEEIINGIIGSDALLLLLSEQANQSPHVLREVERAGSSRIPVIVYKLEEVELTKSLEYFLMTNQWIDGAGDSDCQKVLEAFRGQPDHKTGPSDKTQPDENQPEGNQSERESRKKGGQSAVKVKHPAASSGTSNLKRPKGNVSFRHIGIDPRGIRQLSVQARPLGSLLAGIMVPALVLLLAIAAAAFAVSKTGHAGNVTADSKGQGENGETLDTGGGIQDAETADLSLGASVEFGAYGGEPIVWRVLHISEDGRQLILVSDKILTMKAFDAAESGKYNSDGDQDYWMTEIEDKLLEAHVRGSNLWCDSNIRTWLNSDRENVVYEDQAPTAAAMSEKKNGYSNEAGFLHGFTEEERAVLRETQIFTIGNVLMDSMGTETDDRVFLLSQGELEWFDEADISICAAPTENAVEQDQTGWYEGYSLSMGVEEYLWLLRDPAENSTSRCMAVGNGYHAGELPPDVLEQLEAGAEGFGIRPAICVDRQALAGLLASR